jgi:hypothetical protein
MAYQTLDIFLITRQSKPFDGHEHNIVDVEALKTLSDRSELGDGRIFSSLLMNMEHTLLFYLFLLQQRASLKRLYHLKIQRWRDLILGPIHSPMSQPMCVSSGYMI